MIRIACSSVGVALMVLGLTWVPGVQAETVSPSQLIVVLDASGSMWGQIEGENKIVIARRVLGGLIDELPDRTEIALVAYGHRQEGDCADIETVVPLGALDRTGLKASVEALNPKGKTPITDSVKQAIGIIERGNAASGATVILVSDGLETCGGDPCAAVRSAKEAGVDFIFHVVGFDVAGEDTSQLECAAAAGGGLFLGADDAQQLGEALDTAVALPAELPAGRLSVKAIADGALQDVAVSVTDAASGEDMGGGRTYTRAETNPRVLPLPDGTYDVRIKATGIKGDIVRRFEGVVIEGGALVEKTVDFSTGSLAVEVRRNGELSDATVRVNVVDGKEVASGRTYTSGNSNPRTFRLTAGRYSVAIKSVEIKGDVRHSFGVVEVPPGGAVSLEHAWSSGTLRVGVTRGDTLVDATVRVRDPETNKEVAGGRTYTRERTNPKAFVVQPGTYKVVVTEIRGETRELMLDVPAGEIVDATIDLEQP